MPAEESYLFTVFFGLPAELFADPLRGEDFGFAAVTEDFLDKLPFQAKIIFEISIFLEQCQTSVEDISTIYSCKTVHEERHVRHSLQL